MAATQAELEVRLEEIDAAISSGALIVKHGDTSVTYKDNDQMLQARQLILSQLAKLTGVTRTRVNYVRQSSKGL